LAPRESRLVRLIQAGAGDVFMTSRLKRRLDRVPTRKPGFFTICKNDASSTVNSFFNDVGVLATSRRLH
jgi:hypothetical protein